MWTGKWNHINRAAGLQCASSQEIPWLQSLALRCLYAVARHGAGSDSLYLKWCLAVVVFQFLVSTPKQQHSGTAVLHFKAQLLYLWEDL